jgi:predicted O-methyltransferase YrrM
MREIKLALLFCILAAWVSAPAAQTRQSETDLDRRVKEFLEKQRGKWYDWNIPEADGRLLYNLIVKHGYTRALEIGTSTGHSAIWIAWALSKTGGKLITIEIDERRYRQALRNFEKAGLSRFIDARLADAHKLVPRLEGPFDFVFIDADKSWYRQYVEWLLPKLKVGGCIAAHNARMRVRGIREFLNYLFRQENLKTTIVDSSRAGMSVSFKIR